MLQSAEQSGQGDADGQHLIATPWCEEHPGTRIEFVADGGWYEAIAGVVGAHAVMAGRRSWLESGWAQPVPADLAARAEEAEAACETTVYAGGDGLVRGVFAVSDTVKPTSAEAIARLRGMGLRPVLSVAARVLSPVSGEG